MATRMVHWLQESVDQMYSSPRDDPRTFTAYGPTRRSTAPMDWEAKAQFSSAGYLSFFTEFWT